MPIPILDCAAGLRACGSCNANSYREDEAALARFVRQALEAEHNAGDVSADGEQARALASELDYDQIVLDLNHPRLAPLAV